MTSVHTNPIVTITVNHRFTTIAFDSICLTLSRDNTLRLAELLTVAGEHLGSVHQEVRRAVAEKRRVSRGFVEGLKVETLVGMSHP